ncbi:MAG TPA: lipoyl synthase [bacterium]
MFSRDYLKKPAWIKHRIPSGPEYKKTLELLRQYGLATVCEEARCPNIGECWQRGSATIMIMGKVCTRACRFCAVKTGDPAGFLDENEPQNVARVVKELGLRYVVITSVDRDDLPDAGSGHYARCVSSIKQVSGTGIEVLIPDFGGQEERLSRIVNEKPTVIGHNIETVKRLTPLIRDRRCGYERSLTTLLAIKRLDHACVTKSSIMVGLGEQTDEIAAALDDLAAAAVDIVTIGQYLQPTRKHMSVQKYYSLKEFDELKTLGEHAGIKHVLSGPMVRSSYRAAEILDMFKG